MASSGKISPVRILAMRFSVKLCSLADTARILLSLGERTPCPIGRLYASLQRCYWSSGYCFAHFRTDSRGRLKTTVYFFFTKTTRTSKPSFFEVVQITVDFWKTFQCRTYLIKSHNYVFGINYGQSCAKLHQNSNFHLLTVYLFQSKVLYFAPIGTKKIFAPQDQLQLRWNSQTLQRRVFSHQRCL